MLVSPKDIVCAQKILSDWMNNQMSFGLFKFQMLYFFNSKVFISCLFFFSFYADSFELSISRLFTLTSWSVVVRDAL